MYTAPASGGWGAVTATLGDVAGTADVYAYDDADGATLLSAASRKVHGRHGTFDLPLTLFGGAPTVEPRRGGPTTLRLTFDGEVFAADGVLDANDLEVTGATIRSAGVAGRVLTLELGDVEDRSVVAVWFGGLVDGNGRSVQGTTHVEVAARFGDVDGNGTVNATDLLLLRRGTAVRRSVTNFLLDLDLSGVVSALDLALARRRLSVAESG
jgi:hypothetical protein